MNITGVHTQGRLQELRLVLKKLTTDLNTIGLETSEFLYFSLSIWVPNISKKGELKK